MRIPIQQQQYKWDVYTPPKTNMSPETGTISVGNTSEPTIDFQGTAVSFQGSSIFVAHRTKHFFVFHAPAVVLEAPVLIGSTYESQDARMPTKDSVTKWRKILGGGYFCSVFVYIYIYTNPVQGALFHIFFVS